MASSFPLFRHRGLKRGVCFAENNNLAVRNRQEAAETRAPRDRARPPNRRDLGGPPVTPSCPKCGQPLDPDARFCPIDGTPVTPTAAGAKSPTVVEANVPHPLPLPLVLGERYRLEVRCGGGGMAQVYRAIDLRLEREVAVKVMNPALRNEREFDRRFQREAHIVSRLADPHIVVAHDYGLHPEHGPFLVMEYLHGRSLRERLADGPLPLGEAMQLAAQLMLALHHAHEKGVVHRDVKPENLFLLDRPGLRLHLRVLDFGVAGMYRPDAVESGQRLTLPGAVIGTPRYMSPEQNAGQPADARSDLYSAAVVVFEALTRQVPRHNGPKLRDLFADAPPALQELLEDCLRINPQKRPANALGVYERLAEIRDETGMPLLAVSGSSSGFSLKGHGDPRPAPPPAPQRSPRRRAMRTLGVVVPLLILGAFAARGWLLSADPRPDPDRESLLELTVGSSRGEVVAKLGPPEGEWEGDPFDGGPATRFLGHVLKPDDLRSDDPASLRVLTWSQPPACAILRENRLRALVVHVPAHAASARGVALGGSEGDLDSHYPDETALDTHLPDPAHPHCPDDALAKKQCRVYRYDAQGIGFTVHAHRVTAITLYPTRE